MRREPDPMFEDGLEPGRLVEREFEFDAPEAGDDEQEVDDLQRRFRRVARQAALDPDDGVEL